MSDLLGNDKIDGCAKCNEMVYRDDKYFRVTRRLPDEDGTGTTIVYHDECAPFGSTNVREEIDKQTRIIL